MQPSGTWLALSVMSEATPLAMPATPAPVMASSMRSAGTQHTSSACSSVHGSACSL